MFITDFMINEQIRDKEVRLIDHDGKQLGIMTSRDALRLAGLDLPAPARFADMAREEFPTLPEGILTEEDCAQAIYDMFKETP